MRQRSPVLLRFAGLAVAMALVSACSPVASGDAATSLPPVTSPSATITTVPADPWALPLDHQVSAPSAPMGPGPSFTESAGCDAPQGFRGPYAATGGFLADTEAVWGPWGDFFGRDIGEVRSHLVRMELPNGDAAAVAVYVNERAAPALQLVIDELLREAAQGNVYPLDPTAVSSFWPATIRPKRYMSFHAMGIAIDVNSRTNQYRDDNTLVTDMPGWFVAAWTDAGWCWGGEWQDIKDAMHFSWKGPRYTPGYGSVAPMPVHTGPAGFTRSLTFETALGAPAPAAATLLADIDRDGAPDVVVVTAEPGTGRLAVDAAEAIHRFDTCWVAGTTPYSVPPGSTLLTADADGDARPDLLVIGPEGDTVAVVAYTYASGYTAHLPVVHTQAPFGTARVFLAEDRDGDGITDLWVVEPGTPGRLEVRAGPDFARRLVEVDLPVAVGASWRFAVGDREGDGVPDLLALGPDRLLVLDGASGLAAVTEDLATPAATDPGTLRAGDFDGDGRIDLYVLGADGRVTVYLGGDRSGTTDAGLMTWFLQGDDQPWEYRAGCPFDPRAPK